MAPKNSEFIPLQIAVLTVSDSRTATDDQYFVITICHF
jgi:molybdenum cofactor biosynthesis protein B